MSKQITNPFDIELSDLSIEDMRDINGAMIVLTGIVEKVELLIESQGEDIGAAKILTDGIIKAGEELIIRVFEESKGRDLTDFERQRLTDEVSAIFNLTDEQIYAWFLNPDKLN